MLVHVFGTFLMSLNRYTATCKPKCHQKFWTNTTLQCLLIIDFVVSYASYTEWFLTRFVYEQTQNGWRLVGRENRTLATRLMGALVVIIFEMINIIFIFFTFRAIRRQKKKYHRKMGQEMSFVILTAINCPVNLLEAFYDLSFLFNFESPIIAWIQSQFDVYFFIMMTMNAYSILILSRALQLEILMRWKCLKYKPRVTSNNKPSNALFTVQ
ncbi:hypothetical protein Y032_0037g3532 [Ancylostoma ceylanicum]|nr:hypothetical protein Y032_0037g3532 [Ancylostoma ceylanicum]